MLEHVPLTLLAIKSHCLIGLLYFCTFDTHKYTVAHMHARTHACTQARTHVAQTQTNKQTHTHIIHVHKQTN